MARFQVDPGQLEDLARRMDALRGELEGAHRADAIPADLGAPRVHAALDGFESEWSDGMAIIRIQLEECARRLHDAATEYASAEACVQSAATSGGGRQR